MPKHYNRTVRITDKYRLFEGSLQARGCFAITRLADGAQTDWNTGSEGREIANRMRRLSDAAFNAKCDEQNFEE